ncbi:MAG: enolase C-terminal domain-like protein [Candidatus Omnitrophota bacterium]
MKIKIREAEVLRVDIPLRKKFKHSITARSVSDSVFLKIKLEDGTIGYGESLPRKYVTGETTKSVIDELKRIIPSKLLGYGVEEYRDTPSFIDGVGAESGALKCVLELAILDAYGRYFKSPISSVIGMRLRDEVRYTGVMQSDTLPDAIRKSLAFKAYDFKFVKIKVGSGDDINRLRIARKILGKKTDMRVDANCAWTADEAIEKIGAMRRFNISAVEQPVKADDYAGLKKVSDSVPETISADESLCSIDDAERLAGMGACKMFNIRISKCGGLIDSLRIAGIARRHNIGVQMGCQVGESGLLSAAGWHFASLFKELPFCEGGYGRFLLKSDITREDMTFGRGGILKDINGPGLGVNIIDEALNAYIIERERFAR